MSEAAGEVRAQLEAALEAHLARRWLVMMAGVLVLVAVAVISTGLGVDSMGPFKAARAIFSPILPASWSADLSPLQIEVIRELRLPRTLLAVVCGACMALAGVSLQGITRNPLVSPFTLGISWASAFGASVAILLGLAAPLIVAGAFASALVCAVLILSFASLRGVNSIMLILGGVGLSYLFQSLTNTTRFLANEQQLSALIQWTFGSINGATWEEVWIVGAILLVLGAVLIAQRWALNAFAAGGDEAAAALGFNVAPTRIVVTVSAVMLTAAIVSFAGELGFVGLVAPHMARLLVGGDHRALLPFSAVVGAILVLVADLIGRLDFAPLVIPAGIVVAYLGVPVFLHLLLARRRELML